MSSRRVNRNASDPIRVVIAVLLIDMLGTGMYLPVSLLYFTRVVDLPLPAVGWCLTAAQLMTLPLPVVIGRLVDRVGARTVVMAGLLLQGFGFCGYLWVHSSASLFATSLLAALGQRAYWSSVFTLIADLADSGRRDHAYGMAGAAQNAGAGLGAATAAVLVAVDADSAYAAIIVVNAATFMLSAAVLRLGVPQRPHQPAPEPVDAPLTPLRDRPFLALVGANTVFAICSGLLALGLPVFVSDALHGPGWTVAVLLGANTAGLALLQTATVKRVADRRRTRVMFAAAVLWASWGVLITLTLGLPGALVLPSLAVVTATYTAAELLHAPTSNALAAEMGPVRSRGRYLATFQFSFALGNAAGPVMFTQLFTWHPAAPFLTAAGCALLAGLVVLRLERRLPAVAVRREHRMLVDTDTRHREPGTSALSPAVGPAGGLRRRR
jgi:MFS family permease